MTQSQEGRWRLGLLAGLGLYLLAILAWSLDGDHPVVAGLYHDDGIYCCLAESLAERGTYRDNHTPPPIQIAKYPPATPLLILVARTLAGGGIEGTLRVLRVIYGLLLCLGLWSFHGLVRRETDLGRRTALALTAAAALAASLLDYLRIPMSEIPYLGLTMFTLWFAGRMEDGEERPWRQALTLGGLCFLVFACRTVGAMTALAVGLRLLLAHRRATAWRFALVALPLLGALQFCMAAHSRPATGWEEVSVYGLPYSRIMVEGLPWLPRILLYNLVQLLFFTVNMLLGWLPLLLIAKGTHPVILWLLTLAVAALAGLGWWCTASRRSPRPGLRAWQLHLLLSLVLVIPWPFQTSRFLVPLLPLLLLSLTLGLRRLGGQQVALAGALILAAVAAIHTGGREEQRAGSFTLEGARRDLRPIFAVGRKLCRVLPEKALVASTLDPLFAAHFGIPGVWGWTIRNQCVDLYGGERSLATFGIDDGRWDWLGSKLIEAEQAFGQPGMIPPEEPPGAKPWLLAEMEKDRELVRQQFRRLGVSHAVVMLHGGQALYDLLLARLVMDLARQGRAEPLFAEGPIQVWRISP